MLSVSSRALVEACARLGLDTDALLASAGLERAQVDNPDGRLPTAKVMTLWREAYERAGDPNLALHAVEALPFGAYTVIDFLARTSSSIGDAIERISKYFPLINTSVQLPIDRDGDHVRIGVMPVTVPRAYTEYTLAAVFLRTRVATDIAFPLARVDFTYDAPADSSEHARIFDCPLRFGADRSGLIFTEAVWNTPVARGDTGLAAVLERHAGMLLADLPEVSDDVGRIRAAIAAELKGGDPRLDHVARKLGLSRRSLQRRLAEEGLTYATVLDQVRSTMARAYLAQRELAIAEIAYLLGFSEQSSFTRAFRRWTSTSPAEFRTMK